MNTAWEETKVAWNRQLLLWRDIYDSERFEKELENWLVQVRPVLFNDNGDLSWVLAVLESGQDAALLSELIGGLETISEELFTPMLRAAVYDPDPSFNRRYIHVCLKHWGGVRVNDELFRYITGTNLEKAGVANAFYHSLRGSSEEQVEKARNWFLEEFVVNNDVQVRRDLIAKLALNKPEKYPESLRPLIPQAIAIARNHPDEYIRHRVEIQLGKGGPFKAKPSRGQD